MAEPVYKTRYGRSFVQGQGLPAISTDTDSIRAYQWEVTFQGLPFERQAEQQDLTLAAKQISPIGMNVEDIEVNRVNDKVYYPGRPSPEEITITFDNLYLRETAPTLWDWFKSVYNPLTGEMTETSRPAVENSPYFKANRMEVTQLDNAMNPLQVIELYGVFPKSWRATELNYSTNEFHTIEVIFRYDFMDVYRTSAN